MPAALKLTDLTLGYEGHPAVHHLTGTVDQGALTAVVGPNGSGKSTLLKGIVGELRPIGGLIDRCARTVHDIAYLPQAANIERDFPATVQDLVMMGLWRKRGPFAAFTAEDRHALADAIETVGLSGFLSRTLESLSGGQLQRALFARTLLQDAAVILLDEPFNAIDTRTVEDLMNIVLHWRDEQRTVMVVLHDLQLVSQHFPECLLIAREVVAWGPTSEVLTANHLARARAMNEAWDDRAHWCEPETL